MFFAMAVISSFYSNQIWFHAALVANNSRTRLFLYRPTLRVWGVKTIEPVCQTASISWPFPYTNKKAVFTAAEYDLSLAFRVWILFYLGLHEVGSILYQVAWICMRNWQEMANLKPTSVVFIRILTLQESKTPNSKWGGGGAARVGNVCRSDKQQACDPKHHIISWALIKHLTNCNVG